MKICTTCKISKEKEGFYRNKNMADGRDTRCKSCRNKAYKNWYNTDKAQEKIKTYSKEYYKRPGVKEKTRAHGINRRFGISSDVYLKMLSLQKNKCAICNKEESCPKHKYLSIDHDHKTGKIRGLLCNKCNKAIGLLDDNPKILHSAINYLTHNL